MPVDPNTFPKQTKKKSMCDCATRIYQIKQWFECDHYKCKQSADMYNFCVACGSSQARKSV